MNHLLLLFFSFSIVVFTTAAFTTYLELRNGAHEGMSEWSTILEDLIYLAQVYRKQGLVLVEPCIKDAQLVGCHIGGSFPVSFAYNWKNYDSDGQAKNQTSRQFNWITWKERVNKRLHNPDSLYHINCKLQKKFVSSSEATKASPETPLPVREHRYLQQGKSNGFPLPHFAKTMENESRIENCVRKAMSMKGILYDLFIASLNIFNLLLHFILLGIENNNILPTTTYFYSCIISICLRLSFLHYHFIIFLMIFYIR